MSTLLLVGHGSAYGPESSAPVRAHAERLRARGVPHDVRVAFWKEAPHLRDALAGLEDGDVYVVPIFMSEGYFTGTIVPRELRLTGGSTVRGGTRVHYCPPIGTHPRMVDLVERRVDGAWPRGVQARDLALIIAGHGTNRAPHSAQSTFDVMREVSRRGAFGVVTCGFLDQAPRLRDAVAQTQGRDTVVVPFFVSEGGHTRVTIPGEIEAGGGDAARIHYAEPVGTAEQVTDIVLDLVENAA